MNSKEPEPIKRKSAGQDVSKGAEPDPDRTAPFPRMKPVEADVFLEAHEFTKGCMRRPERFIAAAVELGTLLRAPRSEEIIDDFLRGVYGMADSGFVLCEQAILKALRIVREPVPAHLRALAADPLDWSMFLVLTGGILSGALDHRN